VHVARIDISTTDNMLKRKWKGDPSCYFRDQEESSSHFFFSCLVAKVIWSIIAFRLGASDRPVNVKQAWAWTKGEFG
jgi:hypothetical protein